jgi:chromate transporter
MAAADRRDRLGELARLFLWLGIVGFGGPVAHLTLMEEQVVRRRGWLTPSEFVDLVGLTNLIPGPGRPRWRWRWAHRRAGLPAC